MAAGARAPSPMSSTPNRAQTDSRCSGEERAANPRATPSSKPGWPVRESARLMRTAGERCASSAAAPTVERRIGAGIAPRLRKSAHRRGQPDSASSETPLARCRHPSAAVMPNPDGRRRQVVLAGHSTARRRIRSRDGRWCCRSTPVYPVNVSCGVLRNRLAMPCPTRPLDPPASRWDFGPAGPNPLARTPGRFLEISHRFSLP